MRVGRAVAGLVLAAGSLLLAVDPLAADAPSGRWTSPAPSGEVDGVPSAMMTSLERLRGTAEFSEQIVAVSFRLVQDAAEVPCSAVATTPPQTQPGGGRRVEFAFDAEFPCNRRYQVEAVVETAERTDREDEHLRLPLWVSVAIPPATVTGLVAEPVPAPGRGVALRWDAAEHEVDFVGFEIRRAAGDGEFRPIGEAKPADTSFTDAEVPASGGSYRYQVRGMRPAPEGDDTVYGEAAAAELDVPATTAGEAGSAPSAESGAGGTDAGGGGSGGSSSSFATPTFQSSRSALSVTTTTVDDGFQETLPFRRVAAPPREDPPVGDPSVVARLDDFDEEDGTRQSMLLVAGGTVAFSWAMALRLLARKAAPVL